MANADIEAATALKLQGNKAFSKHDWPEALECYTKAIEKYDQDPSFWCNRAQVCFLPVFFFCFCLLGGSVDAGQNGEGGKRFWSVAFCVSLGEA